MSTPATLDVVGVRKSYGILVAVDGVSFDVRSGEVLGLLGLNGAGKTTIVSLIAGLARPDAGTVHVCGLPTGTGANEAKHHLGLVPQDLALYDDLSAHGNLLFFAALYGLDGSRAETAAHAALQTVGLAERRDQRVNTFSGGMKRRLNLAVALLHDPQVLVLDEPTVGVDPQSRNALLDGLEGLKRRGKSIVYTTHYMEEAERICDRVVVIDHGRVIAHDSPRGLLGLLPAPNRLVIDLAEPGAAPPLDALAALPEVAQATCSDGRLVVALADLLHGAPAVLAWLVAHGVAFTHFASERGDLETVFLSLTGRGLRDS